MTLSAANAVEAFAQARGASDLAVDLCDPFGAWTDMRETPLLSWVTDRWRTLFTAHYLAVQGWRR